MDSGRHKADKDVFLGTADIIAQVKLAQARPAWRLLGAVRLYVLAVGSLTAGLFILLAYWRALPARRPAADDRPSLQAEAPSADAAKGGAVGSAAANPKDKMPGGASPSATLPIKIALVHQAGALWIDGTKVADKKRVWTGHLAPGNHQLAVRVGGHMMRHSFVVESEALSITLDPARHTFVVSSSGKGHRSARARSR